jgi:hypothetical protein
MQSLSGGASGCQATKDAGVELECTLLVAKWVFGVMQGHRLKILANDTLKYKAELFDSLMSSPDLPSASLLREVLRWADFYDFPFFPRLLAEILYEMATIGGCYALSALTIAIDLEDLKLAKYATKRCSCVPDPSTFGKNIVHIIGLDAWWCMIIAQRKASVTPWTGLENQWKSIADRLVL